MSAIIIIAKSLDTLLPVHMNEAGKGRRCNCVCYKCGERLQARKGLERVWHFSHDTNSNCQGNNESALHKYAIELVLKNNRINTGRKALIYGLSNSGTKVGKYNSDACVNYNQTDLHFEIVVHHEYLNTEKERYYKANKINCIRIDLTDPYLLTATAEEIEYAVLKDSDNKLFTYWHGDEVDLAIENQKILEWIFSAVVVIGSIFSFKKVNFPSKKRKTNSRKRRTFNAWEKVPPRYFSRLRTQSGTAYHMKAKYR